MQDSNKKDIILNRNKLLYKLVELNKAFDDCKTEITSDEDKSNKVICMSSTSAAAGHVGAISNQYTDDDIKCAKFVDDEGDEFMFYTKLYILDKVDKLSIEKEKLKEFIPEINFDSGDVLCKTGNDIRFIMENLKSKLYVNKDPNEKTGNDASRFLLDFKLGHKTVSADAAPGKIKSQSIVDEKGSLSSAIGYRLESSGIGKINEIIRKLKDEDDEIIKNMENYMENFIYNLKKIKSTGETMEGGGAGFMGMLQKFGYTNPRIMKNMLKPFSGFDGVKSLMDKVRKSEVMSSSLNNILNNIIKNNQNYNKEIREIILNIFFKKLHDIVYKFILPNYKNVITDGDKYSFGLIGSSLMIAFNEKITDADLIEITTTPPPTPPATPATPATPPATPPAATTPANSVDYTNDDMIDKILNMKVADLGHGYLYHKDDESEFEIITTEKTEKKIKSKDLAKENIKIFSRGMFKFYIDSFNWMFDYYSKTDTTPTVVLSGNTYTKLNDVFQVINVKRSEIDEIVNTFIDLEINALPITKNEISQFLKQIIIIKLFGKQINDNYFNIIQIKYITLLDDLEDKYFLKDLDTPLPELKDYKIKINDVEKDFNSSDINQEYSHETTISGDTEKSEKRQKKLKLIPKLLNHMTAEQVETLLIKYGEITTNEPIDFEENFSILFDKIKEIAKENDTDSSTA